MTSCFSFQDTFHHVTIDGSETELFREHCPNITEKVKRKISKTCSLDGLKRKLPITNWLPSYPMSYFLQDVVAGISVGLTAIPQGIAIAAVAGLPPQYGLYSGFMGKENRLVNCNNLTDFL